MRLCRAVLVLLLCAPGAALAGPSPADPAFALMEQVATDGTASEGATPMVFQFDPAGTFRSPGSYDEPDGATGYVDARKRVVAISLDKTAAWIAADLAEFGYCGDCGMAKRPVDAWQHGTMLIELGEPWTPVAAHLAYAVDGKRQAAAIKAGATLPALPPRDNQDADDVARQFMASIADPALFAATVSDRKDVVLYGSALPERYVGGAKVRAQLKKWNLAFTVRDGVHAGLTRSKTVAWVAANVDAISGKKPAGKASPYRVLAIYERTRGEWKLVQVHFAFIVPPSP